MGLEKTLRGKIPSPKRGQAVAQAAWVGGGVTIPGGVAEPWGCGTEGSGHGGGGLGLDWMISVVFSSLHDSILSTACRCCVAVYIWCLVVLGCPGLHGQEEDAFSCGLAIRHASQPTQQGTACGGQQQSCVRQTAEEKHI